MGLRYRRLCGTYFEVGRLLGEQMRGFVRPQYDARDLRLAEACAGQVERFYPEALTKLRGIIAGGDVDAEQFRCHFLTKGAPVAGCVGVVVGPRRSATAEPLVGRNYHWPLADRVWCELRLVGVTGELAHLGYTHHWGGLPDMLNSAGLYVAIFSVPQLPVRGAGLQWHIIIDYLGSRCRTVAEGREFLLSIPHLRSFSYLLTDASGSALVAEATPRAVVTRTLEEDVLVATNHHVRGEAPATGRERSRALYEALRRRLQERERWDWEGLRALVADHEIGVCVGDHTGRSASWGTLYGALIRPAAREFAVAPGFPCQEAFERVTVPLEVAPV